MSMNSVTSPSIAGKGELTLNRCPVSDSNGKSYFFSWPTWASKQPLNREWKWYFHIVLADYL